MIRISVDDKISELGHDHPAQICDALTSVLSTLPENRVVTEITLDGQQFNQSSLKVPLETIKELQIRTASKEIWRANGIDIALTQIERVQKSLVCTAELLRCEDREKAYRLFVHCIDGLERFLESIMITRCVLNLNFDQILVDGISLSKIEEDFNNILATILTHQREENFIGIADKVEYELLTNLHSWTKALNQLRYIQPSQS